MATDLDHLLRRVDTLLLVGNNADSCVPATVIAADVLDDRVVVVEDCVGTMDNRSHQAAALL